VHVSQRVSSSVSYVLWRVGVRISYSDEVFWLVLFWVCFENLGFFPLALPLLFDLLQKFHESLWIGAYAIKGLLSY
jgi:hypothetical protein